MKYLNLILLFSLLTVGLMAQNSSLSLEDCVINRELYPERIQGLKWLPGEKSYTFINPKKNEVVLAGLNSGEKTFITLDKLNMALPPEIEPLQRLPNLDCQDNEICHFMHENQVWKYNREDGSLNKVASAAKGNSLLEKASNYNLAYVNDHNLYVYRRSKGDTKQISKNGSRSLTYGEAAHRYEFGITKGLFWSPEGDKLAFYRVDRAMVPDYPLIDYAQKPAAYKPVKYPMAGELSHHATVGVYNVKRNKTIYLDTGKPLEQYLTNITWDPSGKYLYVAIVNRDQNEMKLNRYFAKNGQLDKTLFTESHAKYVEPEHGPLFYNKGKSFLWFSERDGYNHLYQYDLDGKLLGQLTKGEWIVTEFLGFHQKEKYAVISATKESPLERHGYKVSMSDGKMTQLTDGKGTHSLTMDSEGKYLIDSYSSLKVPGITQIIDVKKGKIQKELLKSENPLSGYDMGEMEMVSLTASNGNTLYGRLIKPTNFDKSRKYPVMVYVYGGPHVQLVRDRWGGGAQMFLQYMAQQGFVVFTLDNHGSSGRGFAFENEVHRNMGTQEISDQLKGVEYLKSLPYVDADRMSVFGWSYGGFMTTSLMLREPGTFKVGVAGGPVIDWKFYEIMYTERYMDTPQQNPEGFKKASLLNYVENLQDDLLIIHGLQDDVVVPQHTRAFMRKCVEEGVLIDYLPYPSHPHNVRGADRVHLLDKVSDYIQDRLQD